MNTVKPQMMQTDSFISIKEAARVLNVSYRTVYYWILKGELAGYRFGTTYRISERDLADFIRRCRLGPP
ncbi:MAG: helix-turn-helix domain-containing protein [Firmicutes bacterium]|nr:helix-turn-helix domain-containing protein [Bacillota bacterium]